MNGKKVKELLKSSNSQYKDIAKKDIIDALLLYNSLKPSTEKFLTLNNKKVFTLTGTLPIKYGHDTYNIPIQIYLEDTYPFSMPICYVRPTSNMQINPNQSVDATGYVNIPYLRDWFYPKSSLANFLNEITKLFSEVTPLYTKKLISPAVSVPLSPTQTSSLPVALDIHAKQSSLSYQPNSLQSQISQSPMTINKDDKKDSSQINKFQSAVKSIMKEQQVQDLLGRVKSNFKDLAKRELVNLLEEKNTLKPTIENYTQQNGITSELFTLTGTIPVNYDCCTNDIPVKIYLDENYPYTPPVCYVKSNSNVQINATKTVDLNGSVKIDYLREWSYPKSNLKTLVNQMSTNFSDELPIHLSPVQNSNLSRSNSVIVELTVPKRGDLTPSFSISSEASACESITASIQSFQQVLSNLNEQKVKEILIGVESSFIDLAQMDILNALYAYDTLEPCSFKHLLPNGSVKEKFSLVGTIPTYYKSSRQNIPIQIYLEQKHPFDPPTCFLKPTVDVRIRPSETIRTNGHVNVTYLKEWSYPKSSLTALINKLCEKLSEETPFISKPKMNDLTKRANSIPVEIPMRMDLINVDKDTNDYSRSISAPKEIQKTLKLSNKLNEQHIRDVLMDTKSSNIDAAQADVINTLKAFSSLEPCSENYYLPDGSIKELFLLNGTIPVNYKNNEYNIPVKIYCDDKYPQVPPLCYVRPTKDMSINVTQTIDFTGRINIPYLLHWSYPQSNLLELLIEIITKFSQVTPLYSKSDVAKPFDLSVISENKGCQTD